MNSRDARALVAAYLSRKAADTLHTHVGASLLRDHVHAVLGVHPENGDLARVKRAVVDYANELARRGGVELPFADMDNNDNGDETSVESPPDMEATRDSTALAARRRRRRVRG